jgi:hypothetical protein
MLSRTVWTKFSGEVCAVREKLWYQGIAAGHLLRVRQAGVLLKLSNELPIRVYVLGRPRLKANMEYVVSHPEEFNKVALVQRKVRVTATEVAFVRLGDV